MDSVFSRTELILGRDSTAILSGKTVVVFGLGGVGGYVVETLARSGVGSLIIVDGDVVDVTNINRQIIALQSNVGVSKAELFKVRIFDINPNCEVTALNKFVLPYDDCFNRIFKQYSIDYVVDAVDTVSLKIGLAEYCFNNNISLISAMGCGNRLNADFQFADIYKTSGCPLCKVMRKELKAKKIPRLQVLFSSTPPYVKHKPPASTPWVPAIAGLMIASRVVQDLITND